MASLVCYGSPKSSIFGQKLLDSIQKRALREKAPDLIPLVSLVESREREKKNVIKVTGITFAKEEGNRKSIWVTLNSRRLGSKSFFPLLERERMA